jgi:hypothetical protein
VETWQESTLVTVLLDLPYSTANNKGVREREIAEQLERNDLEYALYKDMYHVANLFFFRGGGLESSTWMSMQLYRTSQMNDHRFTPMMPHSLRAGQ